MVRLGGGALSFPQQQQHAATSVTATAVILVQNYLGACCRVGHGGGGGGSAACNLWFSLFSLAAAPLPEKCHRIVLLYCDMCPRSRYRLVLPRIQLYVSARHRETRMLLPRAKRLLLATWPVAAATVCAVHVPNDGQIRKQPDIDFRPIRIQ